VDGLERWSACFRTPEILAAGGPEQLREAEQGRREETPAA
jgi:hypothetical protein